MNRMNDFSSSEIPNSSDLIKRQDAIDALEKIDCSDGVGISALKCDAVDDALKAIEALPPAQPVIRTQMSSANCISRQAAIDAMLALQAEDDKTYGCRIPESFNGDRAAEALKTLPSAQPKIIRCKECKYRDDDDFCIGRGYPNTLVPDDGFCDKGERRE